MQGILLKIRFFERALSKGLKNPAPFNGQSYQKQKEPGTSGNWLIRLQKNFRKIPLLVILSDQV